VFVTEIFLRSTFAGVVLSEGAEQAKAYRRIFRLGKESWS
jgi:hypothetical protein